MSTVLQMEMSELTSAQPPPPAQQQQPQQQQQQQPPRPAKSKAPPLGAARAAAAGSSNGHSVDEQPSTSSVSLPPSSLSHVDGLKKLVVLPADVPVSVDLVESALNERQYLQRIVARLPALGEEHVLRNAIRRYEQIWLPLQAREQNTGVIAPLDVQWVWHCHMLAPVAYLDDCRALVGQLIDHTPISLEQMQAVRRESIAAWARTTGDREPWDYDADAFLTKNLDAIQRYEQRSRYDIVEACYRQMQFIYQISLPHFGSRVFLETAAERYRQFLALNKTYDGSFLTPMYDLDLIWHSHQLNPIAYVKDMNRLLGRVLNHDDSTVERHEGSKLHVGQNRTADVWDYHFPHLPYAIAGTRARGHGSPAELGIETQELADLYHGIIRVRSVSLENVRIKREALKMRVLYDTKTLSTLRAASDGKEEINRLNLADKQTDVKFTFDKRAPGRLQVNLELFNRTLGRKTQRIRVVGQAGLDDLLPEPGEQFEPNKHTDLQVHCVQQGDNPAVDQARIRVHTLMLVDLKLRIVVAPFEDTNLVPGDHLTELCEAAALNSLPLTQVQIASHSIINARNEPLYQVQVVNAQPNGLALILVRDAAHRLLAKAHLVDIGCLPHKRQLDGAADADTLPHTTRLPGSDDDNGDEQLVVVSNGDGDWLALVGKWIGFQKRIPPPPEEERTSMDRKLSSARGVLGSPGRLQITEYNLLKHTVRTFDLPSSGRSMRYSVGDAHAQLSHINLQLRSVYVPESIAAVFGVAMLFTLCNPDKVRTTDDDLTLRGYMCRTWPLTLACGYGKQQSAGRLQSQRTSNNSGSDYSSMKSFDGGELSAGLSVNSDMFLPNAASCCACGTDGATATGVFLGGDLFEANDMDFMQILEPEIGKRILSEEAVYTDLYPEEAVKQLDALGTLAESKPPTRVLRPRRMSKAALAAAAAAAKADTAEADNATEEAKTSS